jgi:hypothetical protein
MNRTSGKLASQVEAWTRQSLQSGRFLVTFYRRLGDEKQASRALEIMVPSEKWMARMGLSPQAEPWCPEEQDEVAAEAQAWERLLEAQMGICSFHAMMNSPRGVLNASGRAHRAAIRGMETAFPWEWVTLRRQHLLRKVSTLCARLFVLDMGEEGCAEERAKLYDSIEAGIRQGLSPTEPSLDHEATPIAG